MKLACNALLAAALCAAPSAAQHHWIAPAGGDFDDPGNWSTGVAPGYWGETTFDLPAPAPYTVEFDALTHISTSFIEAGEVIFELDGFELQLEQRFRPLIVQVEDKTAFPTLTLRGGRVLVDGPVYVGDYPLYGYLEGSGILVLDGAAVELAPLYPSGSGGDLLIGNGGQFPGVLELNGGARCASGRVVVAAGPSTLRGDDGVLAITADVSGVLAPGRPGVELGALHFEQDLILREGSWTELKVAGLGAGQRDELTVAGTAHLAGNLRVELDPAYAPAYGDVVALLSAGAINGSFHDLELPAAPPGLQWALEYGATELRMELVPILLLRTPVPGAAGYLNTIATDYATEAAQIHLVWGVNPGITPVNAYAGLSLDIGFPLYQAGTATAAGGAAGFTANVPLAASGRTYLLQALELQSYRTSNVVAYTF